MTGQKQIERSLKRRDSFQDQILKGIQLLANNKRRVMMLISPVIAVAVVGYSVFGWMNHQASQRRAELAKILTLQTEEQNGVAKQKEELQKKIEELRAASKPAKDSKDAKKPALSAESLAKITLLEKQIADLKPDTSKSSEGFKKFYDSHKDSPEGWMAGLTWASRQLQDNKGSEARKPIEEIAKASTSNAFYQLNSRFMLIGLLEDSGEFDAAIKECDVLMKLATDDAKPSVLLAKGRLQYFKKSYADARLALNEIVDKHASSPEATKARSLLAAMGPA